MSNLSQSLIDQSYSIPSNVLFSIKPDCVYVIHVGESQENIFKLKGKVSKIFTLINTKESYISTCVNVLGKVEAEDNLKQLETLLKALIHNKLVE
jgi:hypothetical protein